LLLLSGLYFLGVGFTRRNSFAVFLAGAAILVLVALAVAGRIQAARFARLNLQWDSSRPLYARREGLSERLWIERARTTFFYRVHFRVDGRLRVGRASSISISREVSTVGGGPVEIPFYFPLSGVYRACGRLLIRDVFGLTRARFGPEWEKTLVVLPHLGRGETDVPITAVGGEEEESRKASDDEEKYYQREYMPGDRARDINWKASTRLAQLITRISPYTQERSKVITLEVRPYDDGRPEGLESVLHLYRLKLRVLSFIRTMREEHPEYRYRVILPQATLTVSTDDDVEALSRDLAAVFYQTEGPRGALPGAPAQVVVFTTPFDANLPHLLPLYGDATVLVIRTRTARGRDRAQEYLLEPPLARAGAAIAIPGAWALKGGQHKPPALVPLKGEVAEDEFSVSLFRT
jgi:uncharacterized protein (DUF58 family)